MRIGIITYWWSTDNYGQLLQCWALQYYLKQMGYEPFLIRYTHVCRPAWERWMRRVAKAVLVYPLIRYWKNRGERKLMEEIERKNTARRFDDFRNQYIVSTPRCYHTLGQLQSAPPQADVYMVGSDQVWAPVLLRFRGNLGFWLDFGLQTARRISYAASFGTDRCPDGLKPILHQQLKCFDAISVREATGIDICREAGREATHVVDPTLLLTRRDYVPFIADIPVVKQPYVFIYSINIAHQDDVRFAELQTLCKANGCSIVVTTSSGYMPGRELFEGVVYQYATIPQWLTLIAYAQLVVTTSFHGVVFCIQLHRHFVYFPLAGKYAGGNSRVTNLLERIGLSDCIYREQGDYERVESIEIDWEQVDEQLKEMRRESEEFLKEALR